MALMALILAATTCLCIPPVAAPAAIPASKGAVVCVVVTPSSLSAGATAAGADADAAEHDRRLLQLAGREARRSLYLATGSYASLQTSSTGTDFSSLPGRGPILLVGHRAGLQQATEDDTAAAAVAGLLVPLLGAHDDTHLISANITSGNGRPVVVLAGTTPRATLYAAAAFANQLGAHYTLGGAGVPPRRVPMEAVVRALHEHLYVPKFGKRGLQPFHDFPMGPDWWSDQDYRAFLTSAANLKFNLVGLHTYPPGSTDVGGGEPTVWVGNEQGVGPKDTVLDTPYRVTTWFSTQRAGWGLQAMNTSDYCCGGAALFSADAVSSPTVAAAVDNRLPNSTEDYQKVFASTAAFLRGVFSWAKRSQIEVAIGTEMPLLTAYPQFVNKSSMKELYSGIFKRIAQTTPGIDYYWMWTPEGSMGGNISEPVKQELATEFATAHAALKATAGLGGSTSLATCGWGVGPSNDRTFFDDAVAADVPVASLDPNVGWDPVDPAFGGIKKHKTWDIVWLEDDPGLAAIEMWVNRTLTHAAEAKKYGVDGLLGIHWRTAEIAPQVAALKAAHWDAAPTDQGTLLEYAVANYGTAAGKLIAPVLLSMDSFSGGPVRIIIHAVIVTVMA